MVNHTPWRCLLSNPLEGAWNMAVDEAILEAVGQGLSLPTLRLFAWRPPCLSLGYAQSIQDVDQAALAARGWQLVRRPTGGRAVWHDAELTYAVAAPIAAFGTLAESYRAIHARLAAALRTLGAVAELAPRGRAAGVGDGPCFATPVGGEVLVHGKKVVGSAQVRHGAAFLQHGSILLDGSQEMIQLVSRQPSAVSAASSLTEVLGRPVGFTEVADAIVAAWGEPLATSALVRPRPPSSAFASPAWTWRR